MWVWEEDDEIEPIALLLSNPGSYFCVMLLIASCGYLITHLGGLVVGTWGYTSDVLFGSPPRLKWIIRLFMIETSVCSYKPL